jgi:hypothetical protein
MHRACYLGRRFGSPHLARSWHLSPGSRPAEDGYLAFITGAFPTPACDNLFPGVPEACVVFPWVRSHESLGATRHSIHGSGVCPSRPRATAATRRRFHGATAGGATCGT